MYQSKSNRTKSRAVAQNVSGNRNQTSLITDNRSRQITIPVSQFKRDRGKEEEENTSQLKSFTPLQRAVKASIPDRSRVIVENIAASDLGDKGTIIRESSTGSHCKVVEFDNELGVFYRVYLHEMSALDETVQEEHGEASRFGANFENDSGAVFITAEVDLLDDTFQTADFYAFCNGEKIGKLNLTCTDGKLNIGNIYTNLSKRIPKTKVPGLGTLFMKIAAEMAIKLKKATIMLGASRQNMNEGHPAAFYDKFSFKSTAESDHVANAKLLGTSLEEYLEMLNQAMAPIEMEASATDVNAIAGDKVRMKNWH